MVKRPQRGDEHLEYVRRQRRVIEDAIREHGATPARAYVVTALRWWFALTLAACGGGRHADTYARATNVQQKCCEHLAGDSRDTCLHDIIRIDDATVARSDASQSTYACVTEHFSCDSATGRATKASAQAQLDCIQDLPQ
jgi:hypothetical protein